MAFGANGNISWKRITSTEYQMDMSEFALSNYVLKLPSDSRSTAVTTGQLVLPYCARTLAARNRNALETTCSHAPAMRATTGETGEPFECRRPIITAFCDLRRNGSDVCKGEHAWKEKGKLKAYSMKRAVAGAHLPTPRFFRACESPRR